MIGHPLEFEVEVDGKKVGFEICMLSLCITEELTGKPIKQIWAEQANLQSTAYVNYFLGAAKAYNKYRDIKTEITFEIVSRCFDKHRDVMLEKYNLSLNGPKNDSAPTQEETTGQQQ